MGKLLALALVVLFAWWMLRNYRKRIDGGNRPPATGKGEDMVRCAQCGVHLPRSESLVTHGEFYCSAEHRREHAGPD